MIEVGHSPDADDIFMYYPIVFGWVDSSLGLSFKNVALDIQTLNERVLSNSIDVSAISFGVYPWICDNYALLRTGVSFGNGYGPKLIKKVGSRLKRNFKVALAGEHTSSTLLFRCFYPEARVVYKNFLEIEGAVLRGEVDAGVLIHESILEFDPSLCVEVDFWEIWCELCGEVLPLPLGGMCIRRSLPLNQAIDIEKTLIQAVICALRGRNILSHMLIEKRIIRVDSTRLATYLSMYANNESIKLEQEQIRGINKMFEIGFRSGFYDRLINSEDYFIPSEYEDLRYS